MAERSSDTSWRYVPGRALWRYLDEGFVDYAGSLAFRSLLALFPALIALVSILGLFGQSEESVIRLLNEAEAVTPAQTWSSVRPVLETILRTPQAGLGLVVGLVTTLWTASGYVKTFSRAMNAVYETSEGRGLIKWNVQMYLLTAFLLVVSAVAVTAVVVAGPVAETVGALTGLGGAVLTVWRYLRWGVMVLAVVLLVGLLYRTTPNIRMRRSTRGRLHRRVGWFSVGACLAIVATMLATFLFFTYVSRVRYYSSTYGALAGVIVLMLWLFIINAALVFGAVIDSEVERIRQLRAGIPAEESLQMKARDTTAIDRREIRVARDVERAREVRRNAEEDADDPEARPVAGSDYSRGRRF